MDFSILGPTRVTVDGRAVDLGAVASRVLLTDLLVHPGQTRSVPRLTQDLGDEPLDDPASPTSSPAGEAQTEARLTRLRELLGADRLLRTEHGWQLLVEAGELDAQRFEGEVEAARQHLTAGDPTAATELLEHALARWEGPALADGRPRGWAAAEAERLDELRLVAEDLQLDSWLLRTDLERGLEVFEAATARTPGREGVWARYMVALYRVGRAADALSAYQRLFAHLGGEPSDWVVRIERDIAFRDRALLQPAVPNVLPASRVALATSHRAEVELPEGVVTFLMTDVVGSTRLWERAPRVMRAAMVRHDQLMIEAVESHSGILIRERGEGDSTFSVFRRSTDAFAAAVAAQTRFGDEPWDPEGALAVRMALHTAEVSPRDGDYYGRMVNRVARLRAIAEGGQILVSQSTAEILMDHLPEGSLLRPLGPQALKDMDRPESVYLVELEAERPGRTDPAGQSGQSGLTEPDQEATTGGQTMSEVGSAPGPAPDPETATWELVVGADRHYFESNGDDLGPFPAERPSRTFALVDPIVVIGRATTRSPVTPDLDLGQPPEDTGVSRGQHAVLERQPDGRYAIADAASTNGTFVNSLATPIPSGIRTMLEAGDRIYLGNFTCLLIQRVDGPER